MVDDEGTTQPDEQTRETEEREASRAHAADRPATPEEEKAAEESLEGVGEDERRRVAEHYEEMSRIGTEAKGEGRIE